MQDKLMVECQTWPTPDTSERSESAASSLEDKLTGYSNNT